LGHSDIYGIKKKFPGLLYFLHNVVGFRPKTFICTWDLRKTFVLIVTRVLKVSK